MPSATTTPHATRPAAWSPPRELGAAALRKWRALRPRDRRWAVGVVGCAAALVTAELISHRFRDFYKDRPLQAGFVTGVVLALLAYLVIDAVRANLNEKRWTPLSKLAFLALAAETTLVIDTLLSLVTGMRPDRARRTDAAQKDLQAALAAMGLKPWQGDDLGAVAHTEYRDQLVCVLSDRAWLALALREIGDRKWGNRDGLAKWAGAMLTIPEAANVFGRLARLNNFLSGLQEWLRALKGQSGYEHIPATATDGARIWLGVLAEAISLREDLTRVSHGALPGIYPKFRGVLACRYRRGLEDRECHARADGVASEKTARALLVDAFVEVIPDPRAGPLPSETPESVRGP